VVRAVALLNESRARLLSGLSYGNIFGTLCLVVLTSFSTSDFG